MKAEIIPIGDKYTVRIKKFLVWNTGHTYDSYTEAVCALDLLGFPELLKEQRDKIIIALEAAIGCTDKISIDNISVSVGYITMDITDRQDRVVEIYEAPTFKVNPHHSETIDWARESVFEYLNSRVSNTLEHRLLKVISASDNEAARTAKKAKQYVHEIQQLLSHDKFKAFPEAACYLHDGKIKIYLNDRSHSSIKYNHIRGHWELVDASSVNDTEPDRFLIGAVERLYRRELRWI